jgi:murein hydrolase activator
MRRVLFPLVLTALLGGGLAAAQPGPGSEAEALKLAKQQAEEATERYRRLEQDAARATGEAARARAEAEGLAAQIEAAEADITAAETRLRMIEALRATQRARLAEREAPVVRLTAALQTMARRPPALALVQPGTVEDVVHVRSLLASTLPVIRARTAALRSEVEAGNRLAEQTGSAYAALVKSRQTLQERRVALARFEAVQRERSATLTDSALFESDRALALGEEARSLNRLVRRSEYQSKLASRLAGLPGPLPRPGNRPAAVAQPGPRYLLPVEGRLVTGVGEISDAGVHARGLTFETTPGARVVAPAAGRIVYAGVFRTYGDVVILDHGRGFATVITDLASSQVEVGETVRQGAPIGRAGEGRPHISIELRRDGRPIPVASLIERG